MVQRYGICGINRTILCFFYLFYAKIEIAALKRTAIKNNWGKAQPFTGRD